MSSPVEIEVFGKRGWLFWRMHEESQIDTCGYWEPGETIELSECFSPESWGEDIPYDVFFAPSDQSGDIYLIDAAEVKINRVVLRAQFHLVSGGVAS